MFSVIHNWKLRPPDGTGPLIVNAPVPVFKLICGNGVGFVDQVLETVPAGSYEGLFTTGENTVTGSLADQQISF